MRVKAKELEGYFCDVLHIALLASHIYNRLFTVLHLIIFQWDSKVLEDLHDL